MLRLGSSKKKDKKEKPAAKPKPKKEKAAKAPKPKPKKEKMEGVVVQKQKTNIYTVMLILSLVANLIACILLWLELGTYGGFGQW